MTYIIAANQGDKHFTDFGNIFILAHKISKPHQYIYIGRLVALQLGIHMDNSPGCLNWLSGVCALYTNNM